MNGFEPVESNFRGFCGDLDEQLIAINSTLGGIKQKLEHSLRDTIAHSGPEVSTTRLRAMVNECTIDEMEKFTDAVSKWNGAQLHKQVDMNVVI